MLERIRRERDAHIIEFLKCSAAASNDCNNAEQTACNPPYERADGLAGRCLYFLTGQASET
jgi:hypothetical protein